MNTNMNAITASCALRRPRVVSSRSDVVLYRPARGSKLAGIAEEIFICEACWNGWISNTGAEMPGQWVRTEIRRLPGTMCDCSDTRLFPALQQVAMTKTIAPLEIELEGRIKAMGKCAAEGGSHCEMYEVTIPPRNLPPVIPASFRPDMRILVCPKCFDTAEGTPLAQWFQKVPAATNAKCVPGSHSAIAGSLIIAASENDIDVFLSTAWSAIYFSTARPVRQGHGNCSETGRWYNLDPAIENFILCEACAHTHMWAFPVMRPQIRPEKELSSDEKQWVAENGDPRVCDLSVSLGRFFPTILELYRAQANRSASEFHAFASRVSVVQPCQGPRESKTEVQMWISDEIPGLDICEECYITVFEHSDFGAMFHPADTNKRYPKNPDHHEYNLACDLASPRVKERLESIISDLEHGVTDSFNPFREWLIIRRFNLQKLVLHQWALRQQQLIQGMQMAHTQFMSVVYHGIGSIQSVAGNNDGYWHGNSNIGWHENENLATSAKLFNEASSMNTVQPLADVMQVEMQIQQLI